ncbi:MAG: extracellular solute-binding protein [Chloroflexota bacterium]
MVEIEFSVMTHGAVDVEAMRLSLARFERQERIKVHLVPIPWASGRGWMEIANMAIHQRGVDVSEIGTTWVGSLAAMNALHPFPPDKVVQVGGPLAYFDVLWKMGVLIGDERVWAIPWVSHPLVLYYRGDWIDLAGIDAHSAFCADRFPHTLETLQRHGVAHPLALAITGMTALHEAAGWVWHAGGDFLSPDGRQVLFNQPAALDGLLAYFSLRRYLMRPKFGGQPTSADAFIGRNAACAIDGPWLAIAARRYPNFFGDDSFPLETVHVPGVAHVGASSLVTWKHTRHPEAAFALIHFLCDQQNQAEHSLHKQVLPARRSALEAIVAQEPYYRVFLDTLQTDRSYPVTPLWGFIEQKLAVALEEIWEQVLADPFSNIEECLHRKLDPLACRLNSTLE